MRHYSNYKLCCIPPVYTLINKEARRNNHDETATLTKKHGTRPQSSLRSSPNNCSLTWVSQNACFFRSPLPTITPIHTLVLSPNIDQQRSYSCSPAGATSPPRPDTRHPAAAAASSSAASGTTTTILRFLSSWLMRRHHRRWRRYWSRCCSV